MSKEQNPSSKESPGAPEEVVKSQTQLIQELQQESLARERKINEMTVLLKKRNDELQTIRTSLSYRVGFGLIKPIGKGWQRLKDAVRKKTPLEKAALAEYRMVKTSTYFDSAYYLRTNPDVGRQNIDPVKHFLEYGDTDQRNPSETFDTAFYRATNPDIIEAGVNSLVHFLQYGQKEGRLPMPAPEIARHGYIAENPIVGPVTQYPREMPYDIWLRNNEINDALRNRYALQVTKMKYQPLISIIMPVYNVEEQWLDKAIQSVKGQIYSNWQLCITDDASTADFVRPFLEKQASVEDRIDVVFSAKNGGISKASNLALEIAKGEFIVFMDNDDELAENALLEIARALNQQPDLDIIYSDEDKIDTDGHRYGPIFKPDWSPDLLISYNYFNKLFCVRKRLVDEVGGLRSQFDGAQDYDLILRTVKKTKAIYHIPQVLYHWRALPSSIAGQGDAKTDTLSFFDKVREGLQEFLDRQGIPAEAYHPEFAQRMQLGLMHLKWPDTGPKVSIIIPSRNHHQTLKACTDSLSKTTYQNFEVIIADNGSDDPDTVAFVQALDQQNGFKTVIIPNADETFSFAHINNKAVEHATGELILFLNDDTAVKSPVWLSQLVGYLSFEGVGVAGAKLIYPDDTVQHAGIINGLYPYGFNGFPEHAFKGISGDDPGYAFFAHVARNYSAVTAACLLISKSLFEKLSGFDEADFALFYNDVDLCLRAKKMGYRTVYVPGAELYHHESKSVQRTIAFSDIVHFKERYRGLQDPYYNVNMSEYEPFLLWSGNTRHSPVDSEALPRLLMVTHNLNLEGAPIQMCEVAAGGVGRGEFQIEVYSPTDGPLREFYEDAGIKVHVFPDPVTKFHINRDYRACISEFGQWLKDAEVSVVLANTLETFYAHEACHEVGIPSTWNIHESVDYELYYSRLPQDISLKACLSLRLPYAIIFASKATRKLYERVHTSSITPVVNYGLKPDRINSYISNHSKDNARKLLNIRDDQVMILNLGTVCARKGQLDFVEAAIACLKSGETNNYYVMVGGRTCDYNKHVRFLIGNSGFEDHFRIVTETKHVDAYYRAADIFVCTSYNESYPRVILEAMIYGLPIITTPVFGISEQILGGISALTFPAGHVSVLKDRILELSTDRERMHLLGKNARANFKLINTFEEMLDQYYSVIKGAWLSKYQEYASNQLS